MSKKVLKLFKVKTSSNGMSQEAAHSFDNKGLGSFANRAELTYDLETKSLSTLLKERLTPKGINLLDISGIKRLQSALNALGYGPIDIEEEFASKEGLLEVENAASLDASSLRNNKLSPAQLSLIKYQLNQSNIQVSGKPDFQTLSLIIKQLEEQEKSPLKIGLTSTKTNTLKSSSLIAQQLLPSKIGPKVIKVKANASNTFKGKSSAADILASKLWQVLQQQDKISEESSKKFLNYLVESVKTPGKLKEVSRAYKSLAGKSLGRGRPVNSGSIINDLKQVQASNKFLSQIENLISSSS